MDHESSRLIISDSRLHIEFEPTRTQAFRWWGLNPANETPLPTPPTSPKGALEKKRQPEKLESRTPFPAPTPEQPTPSDTLRAGALAESLN